MTRLFWRIFLSFWLVIVLTLVSVFVINGHIENAYLDESRQADRFEQLAERFAESAARRLLSGEAAALERWLAQTDRRHRHLRVFVIDDAGDIVGEGDPPRWLRGYRPGSGELPARALAKPIGNSGLELVIVYPPRPFVLRIFGPLGPAGLLAATVLFSGMICWLLARSVTRPVDALRRAGRSLGEGNLEARIDRRTAARGDELGQLSRDFNAMAGRIERLLSSQRQLLRDVSHELRSPLARLRVSLALLENGSETERHRSLPRMEQEIERLDRLIGEILDYARMAEGQAPAFEPVDLVELIDDIAESAGLEGRPREIGVEVNAPDELTLEASPELLYRAIENVMRNALRHSPDGSIIELVLRHPAQTGRIEITVSDHGPGVAGDQLERIFEPFVRISAERSEAGSGGGIGLAIARAAIERHGGTIQASNRRGGGLMVTIRLPRDTS